MKTKSTLQNDICQHQQFIIWFNSNEHNAKNRHHQLTILLFFVDSNLTSSNNQQAKLNCTDINNKRNQMHRIINKINAYSSNDKQMA